MNKERKALIKYRITQAKDSIDEAKTLLDAGKSLRSVVNRLYYAMFYAVLALLQERQLGTSKHIGAISLFDREFVKSGIFPKRFSKILHHTFELRQKGDYMEQTDITKEDVNEILPNAEEFVKKVEEYLSSLLNDRPHPTYAVE